MGESLPLLSPGFNKSLQVEARPERLTADAGAVILRDILDKTGMVDELAGAITDPRLASNVTHPLADLLRTNLLLTAQGWTRQGDADFLRGDPAFRVASSAQRGAGVVDVPLASQSTLSRLLGILAPAEHRQAMNEALVAAAGARVRATRRGHRPRHLTLDVDGLPVPVQGHQAGSAWNGHYGERIFYPLIASAAETGDMLGAMLRPGNAGSATDADTFIEDVVRTHPVRTAIMRLDGFPVRPCTRVRQR